jgi:hypothetical protein
VILRLGGQLVVKINVFFIFILSTICYQVPTQSGGNFIFKNKLKVGIGDEEKKFKPLTCGNQLG